MHSTLIASLALLSASTILASPTPKRTPASPSPEQIAMAAGGGPPNSGAPTGISASAIADFGAVNFLENLEVAFFTQGLAILEASHGHKHYDAIREVVTAVIAQEQVHVETAEGILKANNASTFSPCEYTFPVNDAPSFLKLANVITSVGMGGVINIISGLAVSDPKIVQGPASILAIEARHDAFFREVGLNIRPNPSPFDTRISAPFALNLAIPFVKPGSCKATPSFPHIEPMSAVMPDASKPTTGSSGEMTFEVDTTKIDGADRAKLQIGWVNQANNVAYESARVTKEGVKGEVKAMIAQGQSGIAFAALTNQKEAVDVNALTAVTLAGPAPVQIS